MGRKFPQTQRQDVPDGPDQTTQPVRLNVSDVPGTPNGNNRSNDQGPPSLIKFGMLCQHKPRYKPGCTL